MTDTETNLLEMLFTKGYFVTLPNSIGYKAAHRLARKFGLIERETEAGGMTVYTFRIDVSAFHPAVFNNGIL